MQIVKRRSDSPVVLAAGPDHEARADLREMLDFAGYRARPPIQLPENGHRCALLGNDSKRGFGTGVVSSALVGSPKSVEVGPALAP
jgi:hypothetical protein